MYVKSEREEKSRKYVINKSQHKKVDLTPDLLKCEKYKVDHNRQINLT